MTNKQKRFCEEYVIDFNATRAALAAGYSKKTAGSIGSENLKKHEISTYIDEIQQDLAKLSGVSALRNIMELKKIAYSSIAHMHNTWIELTGFEALTDDQKDCIESIEHKTEKRTIGEDELGVETKYVKIKLYNKLSALEMMNKMLGFNEPDKVDLTTKGDSLNDIESKTTDELIKRAAALKSISNAKS